MKPAFRIEANSKDITALISDRLLEMTITDEAGVKSDRLTVELDDREALIGMPSPGAVLKVAIGYEDAPLVNAGKFTVDEVEVSGMPRKMTIRASAVDFTGKISSPKEESWHGRSLADIAREIAFRNDLMPAIDPAAGDIRITHTDQNESDLQFVTRLAQENGAVAKVQDGKLVLAKRGQTKASVSGKKLPTTTLTPSSGASWRMTSASRGDFQSVKAYWHDRKSAKRQEAVVGDQAGKSMALTHTYATEDEAANAAESKLAALKKGKAEFVVSGMVGIPTLVAEQTVIARGFRAGVDGNWTATRVEHKFTGSGGYTTDVECESAN